MVNTDILLEYMLNFRVECHHRLDMMPGDVTDLPIFIYEGAQKASREQTIAEFNLSEEEGKILDKVGEFFLTTIKERDHYGEADDLTVEAIKSGTFF
ncbi:hypothetical protein Curi_c15270 [Gottschalkia acidurici 9a]|uniref:Uncharacterized protein n=1 Tax=Gottschalkia acidurici (strain ATCC 7906 / DSM 604 / BCRC 14475 / CIP 104303 / KCTC 5404 / NCIMB 10678 / 9a) TaxID=1128398 RepID=K0B1H5_GOTA9|nr:hypothetical protein [Gottschalkia acidurici]AFS78536.1 hypothetical protein Curi_c15270 [Gottschalkia acidurici 9a]